MPLDIDEIERFVNSLNEDQFNILREIVYARVVDDLKKTENVKEKILAKQKPRLLWDND